MNEDADILRQIQDVLATDDQPLTGKQIAFLAGAAGFEFGHPVYALDGIGWDIDGNPTGVYDAEQFAYSHGLPVTHQRAKEICREIMPTHHEEEERYRIGREWGDC